MRIMEGSGREGRLFERCRMCERGRRGFGGGDEGGVGIALPS